MIKLPDIITFFKGLEYGKRKNLSTAKDALPIIFFPVADSLAIC